MDIIGISKIAEFGERSWKSKAAVRRNQLMVLHQERLAEMAKSKILDGSSCNEFVMVCVRSLDERWKRIAEKLEPREVTQNEPDKPITLAVVTAPICDVIGRHLPEISAFLARVLPENRVKTVVLDNSGATVYDIVLRV